MWETKSNNKYTSNESENMTAMKMEIILAVVEDFFDDGLIFICMHFIIFRYVLVCPVFIFDTRYAILAGVSSFFSTAFVSGKYLLTSPLSEKLGKEA